MRDTPKDFTLCNEFLTKLGFKLDEKYAGIYHMQARVFDLTASDVSSEESIIKIIMIKMWEFGRTDQKNEMQASFKALLGL